MRPDILTPLFAPVSSLEGVGQKTAALFANLLDHPEEMDEPRIASLLFHLPFRLIDRRNRPNIAHAPENTIVTLELTIDRHQPPPRGNRRVPYRVYAHDASDEIALTFFRGQGNWLERALPVGETMLISGTVERFNGRASMVHPDYMVSVEKAADLPMLEPVYHTTAGLGQKMVRKAIESAIERIPHLPDWLDDGFAARERFPEFAHALDQIHNPQEATDIDGSGVAMRRLAYDELLAGQLALALVRKKNRAAKGAPIVGTGEKQAKVLDAFGFELTGAQKRTLDEVKADMALPERMIRLVQGDVGAGKTIVALLALAACAEAGFQGALMAPTEVLARQHMATIGPLAEAAGLTARILTGREKGAERKAILADLENGTIDILIGTHALFQDGVNFAKLGLAVVDEQHRFGVHQRLMLADKGAHADMLLMTATPIPRTLVMTHYGDIDVSRLDEKPAGRKPIQTIAMPLEKLDTLVTRVQSAVNEGRQIYWICPLVETSDVLDVTAAEDRFKHLQSIFGSQVNLVHGRMAGAEKDAAMADFKAGKTRVLVATTVIEVGVDVPNASIMVIEHAERFGLSQLHQLRGRVGRGSAASTCVLLYAEPLGEVAQQRLATMRETEDGFLIAEKDLELRGAGDVLGTKQSGVPGFRIARPEIHGDLMRTARDDARYVIETDPALKSKRGEALRLLLYLFEKDSAIRLISAG